MRIEIKTIAPRRKPIGHRTYLHSTQTTHHTNQLHLDAVLDARRLLGLDEGIRYD